MTQDKNRLIIAKGIAAMFDVIDTIGFSTHDIDAYTGNADATGDILAFVELIKGENRHPESVWGESACLFEHRAITEVIWS
jgi:hypothetical protein